MSYRAIAMTEPRRGLVRIDFDPDGRSTFGTRPGRGAALRAFRALRVDLPERADLDPENPASRYEPAISAAYPDPAGPHAGEDHAQVWIVTYGHYPAN